MMDWFPIVFIAFKVLVLGTGMFFAIKWHHDQGTSSNPTDIIKVTLECACYILVVVIVLVVIVVVVMLALMAATAYAAHGSFSSG